MIEKRFAFLWYVVVVGCCWLCCVVVLTVNRNMRKLKQKSVQEKKKLRGAMTPCTLGSNLKRSLRIEIEKASKSNEQM